MSQDIVKKKTAFLTELTEMQRRFCEHIIMNEGRTTRTAAAIAAGYAEKYLKRQYMLSAKIEREEKASKTAAHENLIGKAGGLFIETRINTNMSDIDFDERMKRIKELKDIQKDRVKLISESS